jgi:hypothetical protein
VGMHMWHHSSPSYNSSAWVRTSSAFSRSVYSTALTTYKLYSGHSSMPTVAYTFSAQASSVIGLCYISLSAQPGWLHTFLLTPCCGTHHAQVAIWYGQQLFIQHNWLCMDNNYSICMDNCHSTCMDNSHSPQLAVHLSLKTHVGCLPSMGLITPTSTATAA